MFRCLLTLTWLFASCGSGLFAADVSEQEKLFSGVDLSGWQGDDRFWSVEDGVIVGQTTKQNPAKANTFLIWEGGQPGDFEFSCQVRVTGNNSGVQYRSKKLDPHGYALSGYQADLHPKPKYMGMLYGEKTGRGIISTGGQRVRIDSQGKAAKENAFQPLDGVELNQWNQVRIVAVGNRLVHQINGRTTVDVTDDHPACARDGWLGLQLHTGPPMKAEFKELRLRQLSGDDAADLIGQAAGSNTLSKQATAPEGQPGASSAQNTNPGGIQVPSGFVVELIHQASQDQGSWVSLALDPQGRIYACDQAGAGLYRVTTSPDQAATVEKVSVGALSGISGAQGMFWEDGGLWFHRNGGNLLRLTDTDDDDQLDHVETLPGTRGVGEHGNHAVMPTAGGDELYLLGGNHAPLADQARKRVPLWYEGLLLPRLPDPKGHATSRMAPGGWITRVDKSDQTQSLHSVGYRNQYDAAMNQLGDLFTYDSDMEWDFGLPWYRPTRICFAASGSDYGWRNGSGKWPTYYEDTLPSVVDIGPGSPTGLLSGLKTSFPERYRHALFALDWTYGTMYAIHLEQDGAGYRGRRETFLWGAPLPLTDAITDLEGNLVFAVGGRGTESSLYRVRYLGDQVDQKNDNQVEKQDAMAGPVVTQAVQQRRMLESFHGRIDSAAVDAAWPFLSSGDRFLRHAARVAVESQPLDQWMDRVAREIEPQARVTASVAFARMGDPSHQAKLIDGLQELDLATLSESQLLGALRAYALTFLRLKEPSKPQRAQLIATLDPLLPHASNDVNTELIRLLAYLRSETVVAKAIKLIKDSTLAAPPEWSELAKRNKRYGSRVRAMLQAHPPTRALSYAFLIRNVDQGWTLPLRRDYFQFLNEAGKSSGGASYPGYLRLIQKDALATCSQAEMTQLRDVTKEDFNPEPDFDVVDPVGPGRKWTVDEALAAIDGTPDLLRGRSLYFSANCGSCHRFGGLGGNVGPDMTTVRNKFDEKYLIEAIIHPSKVISDQYASSKVLTDDGRILTGLASLNQETKRWTIYPVDENAKPIQINDEAVELVEPSEVSQMPAGLLDRLNASEVRDLIGYLLSGGEGIDDQSGQ